MYSMFKTLAERPEPFAYADAAPLWTTPHIAAQMLDLHLNSETDLASRRPDKIDAIVRGIAGDHQLEGKTLLDLGCGPGLYARKLSELGALVHGVDFSETSIAYARRSVENAEFSVADYLTADFGERQYDIVTLIYGDVCALPPISRHHLFAKVETALRPGGRFILDAFSEPQFSTLKTETTIENNLMDGFWSATDYVGVKQTLLYSKNTIGLDRYTIIEPDRHWVVHNWLEYFRPETLWAELKAVGLAMDGPARSEDWTCPWTGNETPFFLTVRKA